MKLLLKESDAFLPDQTFFTQVLTRLDTDEHAHEYCEIFYVLSGNATHCVDGVKKEIKKNDCFLIKPGRYHSFTFGNSKNFCHRDFLVREGFFEQTLALCPESFRKFLGGKSHLGVSLSNEQIQYLEKESRNLAALSDREEQETVIRLILLSVFSSFIRQKSTPPHLRTARRFPSGSTNSFRRCSTLPTSNFPSRNSFNCSPHFSTTSRTYPACSTSTWA